jgi:hypothetical protein
MDLIRCPFDYMTSANVTVYLIKDLSGKTMGKHYQSHLCKTHWGDLLKFTTPENFIITDTWLDEEEEYHEEEPINLKIFIDKLKESKYTKWNTHEDLFKK